METSVFHLIVYILPKEGVVSRSGVPATVVVVVLVVMLGFQLWSHLSVRAYQIPKPITIDNPLSLELASLDQGVPPNLTCRIAFVVDADCPYSRQLAQRISAMKLEPAELPLWLSISSPERTAWFADRFDLAGVYLFDVPRRLASIDIQRYIDIPVVPTRLVFDAAGDVIDIRITSKLDISDVGRRCPSSLSFRPR